MAFIRWFLGKIILFLDFTFPPKVLDRSHVDRQRIKNAVAGLSLYQYEACPFCVKVRRFLKSQGVELDLLNAKAEPAKSELLQSGGKLQVPCLRIPQGEESAHWLYESNDIISYLKTELHL